jgi:hypothetical protein
MKAVSESRPRAAPVFTGLWHLYALLARVRSCKCRPLAATMSGQHRFSLKGGFSWQSPI